MSHCQVAVDDPRPVRALLEVLRPASLDALLLNIYGPQLMPSHLPVLVSQWSKYYFMQVIPAVLTASLLHGRHWLLIPERVALALDSRGLPVGIRLDQALLPDVQAAERFGALLDDNLQPVIDTLSVYGGVARGVLWGNAGDCLHSCLEQLGQANDAMLADGYALLAEKLRPDGRRNPLFNAVTHVGEPPRRRRERCCLSYQVQWVGRCEHCPRDA